MTFLDDSLPTHDPPAARPRYRAPIGMPERDEGRRIGAVVSVVVHALIIGLLIAPFMMPASVIERMQQGAGGVGPAGGGGGGRGGTGGETGETLRFVRVAPEPVPTPNALPPAPTPVTPKPEPPKPPETPRPDPQEQAATRTPQTSVAAAVPGVNGGSGRDGTSGAGSGGGIGAGVGPGAGSGTGPGTGGGTQTNYPPQPTEFFLPPLPQPSDVRGIKFIAEFDIDSTGRVLDIKFTQTPNGDYNRKIYAVLRAMRFRPGTRPDGTPIRMKAQIGYEF